MLQGNTTHIWSLHPAVDLSAAAGEPILSISDGTVIDHGKDSLHGCWLLIQHGDIQALYAGMALTADYITGDRVETGATIGYVGNALLDENDLGPHLHLETSKDGIFFDPLTLWNND